MPIIDAGKGIGSRRILWAPPCLLFIHGTRKHFLIPESGAGGRSTRGARRRGGTARLWNPDHWLATGSLLGPVSWITNSFLRPSTAWRSTFPRGISPP